MDKSIPAGAAILLRFIYKTEVDRGAPRCYDVIYGHMQYKLPLPITQMTIGAIQAAQSSWSKSFGSSATGAYQFMKATLAELIIELKLPTSMIFSADLQDRLAYHLLKRRGFLEFMTGKIDRTAFAKRLAQEWASFPVLAPTVGARRSLVRGQSYYAGDGVNKSLVKPETVETILDQVKAAGLLVTTPGPIPAPVLVDVGISDANIGTGTLDVSVPKPAVPAPTPEPITNVIVVLMVGILASLTAASAWFSSLPCDLLGLTCGN